jgi:hypothetical protein
MPSPFPGMDPYLEAPTLWPGFHHKFASEISTELNGSLPAPYYADLEMREEVGIIEEGGAKGWIVPDVTVVRHPRPPVEPESGGVAVRARPRQELSESVEVMVHREKIRHHFIEIRDASRGHKLIALIEILSPSNKQRGPDRKAYALKQQEVLESDANLIELDLLRGGRRVLRDLSLETTITALKPPPTYLVLVNRAWRRRRRRVAYQVFPVSLRGCLPCIPVPLKPGADEVPLDLQYVFNRTYDTGPYRRGAVDYSQTPPAPRLSAEDAAWAAELTRPWREPPPAGTGS